MSVIVAVCLSIIVWLNDGTSEPEMITCTDPNEIGGVCGCEFSCINGSIITHDCSSKTCGESCTCKDGYFRAGNGKCVTHTECITGKGCNDISCDCECELDSNDKPNCVNKWEPRGPFSGLNEYFEPINFNEYTRTCQKPKICSESNPCPVNSECVIKDYLNAECYEESATKPVNESICINKTGRTCDMDWDCNSDEVCYDLINDGCNDVCPDGPIGPGSCLKECVKAIPTNYCDDGYIYDSSLDECLPKTCSDNRKIFQNCPICENQCRPQLPLGIVRCYQDNDCQKRCVCSGEYVLWENKCITQDECDLLKNIYRYQYITDNNIVSAKEHIASQNMDRPPIMSSYQEQRLVYWSIGISLSIIMGILFCIFGVISIGYYVYSKIKKPKEYKFSSVVNADVDTTAQ